jgi:SsrA-binding protein
MQKKNKKGKPEYKKISIRNRKASFEFEFLDRYTAGIVLQGSEIKSLRNGRASIAEAYCYIHKGELWIKGMHIAEYVYAHHQNHDETRVRKLLLSKKELNKLMRSKDVGLTIIPVNLFINPKGLAKIDITLAKGKKLYDKRQSLKEKDMQKKMSNIKIGI